MEDFYLFIKVVVMGREKRKGFMLHAKVGNWLKFLFLLVRAVGRDLLMYQIELLDVTDFCRIL